MACTSAAAPLVAKDVSSWEISVTFPHLCGDRTRTLRQRLPKTCRGSALLSERSDKSLEDLRIAVCSPGGTTIEGVESLWESDLDGVVEKALKAAYDRSVELANS